MVDWFDNKETWTTEKLAMYQRDINSMDNPTLLQLFLQVFRKNPVYWKYELLWEETLARMEYYEDNGDRKY